MSWHDRTSDFDWNSNDHGWRWGRDADDGHGWWRGWEAGHNWSDWDNSCHEPAPDHSVSATFVAPLIPANNSGATGFARLVLEGTTLTVDAVATGLTPGEAHPFHIHG